jgi:hypothetical protein
MKLKSLWKLSIPVAALMIAAACNGQDSKENMNPQDEPTNAEVNTEEPANKEATPSEDSTNTEEPADGQTNSEDSTNK